MPKVYIESSHFKSVCDKLQAQLDSLSQQMGQLELRATSKKDASKKSGNLFDQVVTGKLQGLAGLDDADHDLIDSNEELQEMAD